MKDVRVTVTAGEPTPLQLSAWDRLWAILLRPEPEKSPGTVDQTATGRENAHAAPAGRTEGGAVDERAQTLETNGDFEHCTS